MFTAPVSGASALLSSSPATIDRYGYAAVTAIANEQLGVYTVAAGASGSISSAAFYLTNAVAIDYLPIVIR
jgi:hypothetical protein